MMSCRTLPAWGFYFSGWHLAGGQFCDEALSSACAEAPARGGRRGSSGIRSPSPGELADKGLGTGRRRKEGRKASSQAPRRFLALKVNIDGPVLATAQCITAPACAYRPRPDQAQDIQLATVEAAHCVRRMSRPAQSKRCRARELDRKDSQARAL